MRKSALRYQKHANFVVWLPLKENWKIIGHQRMVLDPKHYLIYLFFKIIKVTQGIKSLSSESKEKRKRYLEKKKKIN